jgi:hypothetical protein
MTTVHQKMDLTNAFVAVVLKEAEVALDDYCPSGSLQDCLECKSEVR